MDQFENVDGLILVVEIDKIEDGLYRYIYLFENRDKYIVDCANVDDGLDSIVNSYNNSTEHHFQNNIDYYFDAEHIDIFYVDNLWMVWNKI